MVKRKSCSRGEKTRADKTRLRAPVCAPVETGVERPDGLNPGAGEGAGPGCNLGVTGNPVARSERK